MVKKKPVRLVGVYSGAYCAYCLAFEPEDHGREFVPKGFTDWKVHNVKRGVHCLAMRKKRDTTIIRYRSAGFLQCIEQENMAEDSSPKQENLVSNSGDSAVARLLLASSMAQQDMLTNNVPDINANQESESDDNISVPVSISTNQVTNSRPDDMSSLDINHNDVPIRDIAQQVSSSPSFSPNPYHDHRSPSPSTHSSSPPILTSEVNCEENPSINNDGDAVTNFLSEQRNLDHMSLGPLSQNNDTTSYMLPDSSPEDIPDDVVNGLPNRFYRCRFCNFSAPTYTQLQLHMPKHGGLKALKCPLCDYSTNDKSNFRRHRRLHLGTNPVSVLKCGKCPYSTILPRKFREHYSQVHNERITPHYSVQTTPPTSTYHPSHTYTNPAYRVGHVDLNPHHQTHATGQNGNMSATSALHSLLTGIHTQPMAYSHPTNQTIPNQCVNQYGSFITPTRRQVDQESHLASNYLRSIVSSIMNSPLPAQVPPATVSAISSSGFYLSPNIESVQQISPSQSSTFSRERNFGFPTMQREVKVKVEPPDCDSTPDVSSSASMHRHSSLDDINLRLGVRTLNESYHISHARTATENNEASTSVDVERTNSTGSVSSPNDRTSSVDNTVNTTVKSESSNVAIQCSFPLIKSETCVLDRFERRMEQCVDRAVQCELLASVRRRSQVSTTGESNVQQQEPVVMVANRCCHCGIVFEDEVLYSIHIGCHSHTDPFVCNVCGKQCGNKYGFYSHIMRGHQY